MSSQMVMIFYQKLLCVFQTKMKNRHRNSAPEWGTYSNLSQLGQCCVVVYKKWAGPFGFQHWLVRTRPYANSGSVVSS